MVEPAVPRLIRLLGLVTHLEEHGEATFDELAQHFGVSRDTIKDDIDTLWVSGLPGYGMTDLLDFDGFAYDDGIARLTNSLGLRQVRLAPAEAVALMGALGSIIASGAAPAAAEGALEALRMAVTGATAVTVVTDTTTVDPAVVEALRTALDASTAVSVIYVDAQDRRTERVIEPHRLVTVNGAGYVECFCRRAGDLRTLRLDRIERVELMDSPATVPRRTSEGFVLEPQYQAKITVKLAGRWAFEDLPGVVLSIEEDSVVATFGVANPDVVIARLLAVSPYLERVEPANLRVGLGRAADAILAALSDETE